MADDYEDRMLDRLYKMLDLAEHNVGVDRDIYLETTGHNPHVRLRVPAYVLRKFLKR